MTAPLRFPFLPRPNGFGPQDLVPFLPATLAYGGTSVGVMGLVDSGASMHVVPYDLGAQFGLSWTALPMSVMVGGAAGGVHAKLLPLHVTIGTLPAIQLAFAWAQTNAYPVIFGQANFFTEFDVCFFRSRSEFQIQPTTP